MRVVHVVPTAFGSDGLLGGGERYPLELARALARHVDVELVTFGRHRLHYPERSGLRVRVLRRLALLRGHPAQPVAPQLLWSLRGADVVHTHHTRSAPSRLAALAGWIGGSPVVSTDHGLGRGVGLPAALFDRFLLVSEFSARALDVPAARTDIIYGGVDHRRFRPDDAVRRAGVLYVGRLTPHKGVDVLLAALPDAAELTVVGSAGHDRRPPERGYPALLRRLARGRPVRFAGPVAEAELPAVYQRARVFVLPSLTRTRYGRPVPIPELLGLSVLEAMASGLPVVASRVGGLPEVVRHAETGYLVTPGDRDELRERVGELLGSPGLARRMGARGREAVIDRFTWHACAGRCLRAYERLGCGGGQASGAV